MTSKFDVNIRENRSVDILTEGHQNRDVVQRTVYHLSSYDQLLKFAFFSQQFGFVSYMVAISKCIMSRCIFVIIFISKCWLTSFVRGNIHICFQLFNIRSLKIVISIVVNLNMYDLPLVTSRCVGLVRSTPLRVDIIKWVSNVRPPVVHKKFLRFQWNLLRR